MLRAALILMLLALVLPAVALAYTVDPELDRVSDYFSRGQTLEVRCSDTMEEWESEEMIDEPGAGPEVYGVTHMHDKWIAVQPGLCAEAHAVPDETQDPDRRALAVLVIVHESFHARGFWNEAKVECWAIRNFRLGAVLLGAAWEQANKLLVSGLTWHRKIARKDTAYYSPHCKLPVPESRP